MEIHEINKTIDEIQEQLNYELSLGQQRMLQDWLESGTTKEECLKELKREIER